MTLVLALALLLGLLAVMLGSAVFIARLFGLRDNAFLGLVLGIFSFTDVLSGLGHRWIYDVVWR